MGGLEEDQRCDGIDLEAFTDDIGTQIGCRYVLAGDATMIWSASPSRNLEAKLVRVRDDRINLVDILQIFDGQLGTAVVIGVNVSKDNL